MKLNRKTCRIWKARVLKVEKNFCLLLGEFQEDIEHPILGVIRRGTTSYEYFWKNKWFSIFQFHNPDGSFRNFYCNINTPPTFSNKEISYIDLEIDIIVHKNLSYQILDTEEFEKNLHTYPVEIIENAHKAIEEIKNMITSKAFPFNQSL